MKRILAAFGLMWVATIVGGAELLPIEREVAELVKSPRVTVVHFWAPWCPNCNAELARSGWSDFIENNADVDFIFITTWRAENGSDGRRLLSKNGVGAQPNFKFMVHPNPAFNIEDRMTSFLGLPVPWLPATWVFRDGQLRYALNYGELRFPLLQQLLRDSAEKWSREGGPPDPRAPKSEN